MKVLAARDAPPDAAEMRQTHKVEAATWVKCTKGCLLAEASGLVITSQTMESRRTDCGSWVVTFKLYVFGEKV